MDLTIYPITPEQRATMPSFNNLEKHGMSDAFWDQFDADDLAKIANSSWDKNRSLEENLFNAANQLNEEILNEDSQANMPVVMPQTRKKQEQMWIWGSIAALIIAAVLAKKYL